MTPRRSYVKSVSRFVGRLVVAVVISASLAGSCNPFGESGDLEILCETATVEWSDPPVVEDLFGYQMRAPVPAWWEFEPSGRVKFSRSGGGEDPFFLVYEGTWEGSGSEIHIDMGTIPIQGEVEGTVFLTGVLATGSLQLEQRGDISPILPHVYLTPNRCTFPEPTELFETPR